MAILCAFSTLPVQQYVRVLTMFLLLYGASRYIIEEGMIRVERKAPVDKDGEVSEPIPLGKLREMDFFGELAVLAQESAGVPFSRKRSAYIVSASVVLHTLTCTTLL